MASQQQVRQYLASWFQLGKRVVLDNGTEKLLPQPVISGDRYSPEFEECWQRIISTDIKESYLEGTDETIAQLLAPEWELILCCRCELPLPVPTAGLPPTACPCFDLSSWPNLELPRPRQPVNSQAYLEDIRQRLLQKQPGEGEPAVVSQAKDKTKDTKADLLSETRELVDPSIALDLPLCQCCPIA